MSKKRRIIRFTGILLAAVCLTGCGDKKAEKDLAQGIKILKELDQKDVAAVEKKIEDKEAEEQEAREAFQNRTPDEKFTDAVILGDSITEGLLEYNILSPSKVIATIGISLPNTGEDIEKAMGLRPKHIFLAYGENDVEGTNGDTRLFKEQYQSVVDRIQETLPDTKIFINEILPVQPKVVEEAPVYADLQKYNETIRELCKEEGITSIDNSSLVSEELYEQDGIHMKPEYYGAWVSHMAEVAGL